MNRPFYPSHQSVTLYQMSYVCIHANSNSAFDVAEAITIFTITKDTYTYCIFSISIFIVKMNDAVYIKTLYKLCVC